MLKLIVIAAIGGAGYLLLAGDDPIVEVSARVPACEDAANAEACDRAMKAGKTAAKATGEFIDAAKDVNHKVRQEMGND